jgi:V8-like Glu-specific endopeptidase
MGTGFLVGSDLLLTSAHVVGVEKRDSLNVTFDSHKMVAWVWENRVELLTTS